MNEDQRKQKIQKSSTCLHLASCCDDVHAANEVSDHSEPSANFLQFRAYLEPSEKKNLLIVLFFRKIKILTPLSVYLTLLIKSKLKTAQIV